ncbi:MULTISPECIES: IucA/IucC family protein [Gordonia]|uniref:IucA/IucC family protein n=1 Tax=Gordonia amicalis TaxID=89053 RepID=A0ABU4DEA8_9ACTN|nr:MULTISPECIES: IucA/IucC family protein [Gordonia]ATD69331.1 siderophore biosynthesis protein [Gordonia sp. 1D]MCZ0911304.1 IucA/IucC family siderophore biosynthesis protein [Gordonia amicalis]MDJ0451950.1 IucA/IucC family protein [Gordonia amicalis]MDV6308005.1 IucA/IucC family protein [Gordonia amicalis]MDV7076214.1 IucA/IucC family protein [Gordonia amicalis]
MTVEQIRHTRTAPSDTVSYRQTYHRRIARKILAEFSHERALSPVETAPGHYVVSSADGDTEYRFRAEILALENWAIDESSLRRVRRGEELPVDAIALVVDLAPLLGIGPQALPDYLEEFINTLAISAERSDERRVTAADLAYADFQTIEKTMTEGHPCIVANAGRLGFSAEDIERYAPEVGNHFRLVWVAARREDCDVATVGGVDYDAMLVDELGVETLADFDAVLRECGCEPDDYRYLPVHPWQWTEKLRKLYSADLADRRIVFVGESPDLYQAQQSIRTVFNSTRPTRHYVKGALSIVNMGFTRGMSADYMRTTPLINNWVRGLVADDPYLAAIGFEMIFEVAAIGYRSPTFTQITQPGSEYRKILSALWRESPVSLVGSDEQLATMAALLHVDHHGDSLVGAFIARSGIPAAEWIRRYLRTYLHPIAYLLYRYELKFSPHGENLILVLDNGIPVRAILKDIGEEVSVFGDPEGFPENCARVLTAEPDEIRNLGVLSDIFDDFLRPLAGILHTHRLVTDGQFWDLVAESLREFVAAHPDLDDKFAKWDLFAPHFGAVHMNGLQLRNNKRMVDIEDSYASLIDAGHLLANPVADRGPR